MINSNNNNKKKKKKEELELSESSSSDGYYFNHDDLSKEELFLLERSKTVSEWEKIQKQQLLNELQQEKETTLLP